MPAKPKSKPVRPTAERKAIVAVNEALLLGSLRQHELTESAENLNAKLQEEIAGRQQTARDLAEKARLLDLTHDAIIVCDLKGRMNYWNHGAEQLYGWSSDEALGQTSHALLQTQFPQPMKQITRQLSRTGWWMGELVHTKRNGRRITVLARQTLDQNNPGEPASVLHNFTDITKRKQAEEALLMAEAKLADRALHLEEIVAVRTAQLTTAHAQLLTEADERKRLEAEVATAIEKERERLGQELHDGLAQELTGITMMLHVLGRTLEKPAPAQAAEADRLCGLLQHAHQNGRDLAKSFYPVELEQHGLMAALEGIAHRTQQQFSVSCTATAGSNARARLKDITSVQLFRIAQEAVQNAAKHAHAQNISIRLSKKKGEWLLVVKDDGKGLPEDATESGGMGLRIMQYRARIIQGKLSICNDVNGGVLVTCSSPAATSP